MLGVGLVWLSLGVLLLGVIALVRPLRRLGIATRRRAAAVLVSGALLAALGFLLPAPETRVRLAESRLDELAPVFQFGEFHEIRVDASPEDAYRAVRSVTANEIRFFQTLTFLRRLGRPGPESILHAPGEKPILDVATETTFLLLAEEPAKEIVVGAVVISPPGFRPKADPAPEDYRLLSEPGLAKATMSFRVEPVPSGGSRVTTETRVFATDASTRRRFAVYWRVIYPGSALIRRMWLRAIRIRAEAGEGRQDTENSSR